MSNVSVRPWKSTSCICVLTEYDVSHLISAVEPVFYKQPLIPMTWSVQSWKFVINLSSSHINPGPDK